ncbi:hypothetical protein [Propionibacterium acidifaciens]|uniref:hypothetical protein n=2 Tax=Propionibacterium acidifaciens TaxID=556499 RepID=UPI0028DB1845|nr:hypothetical protein [Propionibacterium acidifaciens]
MPAPHDPPHRHRTPGPRLLSLVLLTALALAAAMIRWANDPEIANPDFIAWAVSGTEHHVDGFTLTELDLEGWLYVIGRDGSGNDVERAYTLRGLFDDSHNRSADSPTVPLRADAGLYEHLADHHRAIAAYCSPPRTTATSTWSRRTVHTNSCSTLRRGGWLDENALPPSVNWDPMEDGIAGTLDAMFAAAAPDRPVTGIDYEFTTAYTHDYVMDCRLHQDGDADTELTTELHLSSDLSEDAISSSRSWTKSHPGGDDEKNSLSRDELDPVAIATLLHTAMTTNPRYYHHQLDIGWDDEFDQFTMRVDADDDAAYALDGTPLG